MAKRGKIQNLENLIKYTIKGELVEQKTTLLLPPGENYGSVVYEVDFKVNNDGKEKEYHAVAKCTPLNKVTQEMFNTQETFKSEIGWYTTVIPTLKHFAKEQGMERELDFFQKLYGARISLDPNSDIVDLDGVILTENLKYLGFKNIDRHEGFDLRTTHCILRDLASFHAVPMAIRHHDPEMFTKNILPYLPTWKSFTDKMELELKEHIFRIYDHIPEAKPLMDRIRQVINKSVMFAQREVREPWITALHLDFWSNNIMVTEDSNPKTTILDLQCPGYGSPASDVVFFLLTSVRPDVIDTRFDDLVNFYHEELTKNLTQLKVPTDIFPLHGFLREIDIEARTGELAHALYHSQVIFEEKGVCTFDSNDENFEYEDLISAETVINDRQVTKFRWATTEAEKRSWI